MTLLLCSSTTSSAVGLDHVSDSKIQGQIRAIYVGFLSSLITCLRCGAWLSKGCHKHHRLRSFISAFGHFTAKMALFTACFTAQQNNVVWYFELHLISKEFKVKCALFIKHTPLNRDHTLPLPNLAPRKQLIPYSAQFLPKSNTRVDANEPVPLKWKIISNSLKFIRKLIFMNDAHASR